MERMAHQIVDQHGGPRDPQAVIDKPHDLVWQQVVGEQTAAHHIKASVAKRQRQSVADYRGTSSCRVLTIPVVQMGESPVEQCHLQLNSTPFESLADASGNIARTGGD